MTTMIIDTWRGVILSDSRGTIENEKSIIVWDKYPTIKKVKERQTFDDTQKIFKVGKHYVSGSGSLSVLELFRDRLRQFEFYTPDTIFQRYKKGYEPDGTTVYITKRSPLGVKTIKLRVTPKKLIFGWYQLNIEKDYIKSQYWISGSGKEFAVGALKAGATLERCIDIAKEMDIYSGGETQIVYI